MLAAALNYLGSGEEKMLGTELIKLCNDLLSIRY